MPAERMSWRLWWNPLISDNAYFGKKYITITQAYNFRAFWGCDRSVRQEDILDATIRRAVPPYVFGVIRNAWPDLGVLGPVLDHQVLRDVGERFVPRHEDRARRERVRCDHHVQRRQGNASALAPGPKFAVGLGGLPVPIENVHAQQEFSHSLRQRQRVASLGDTVEKLRFGHRRDRELVDRHGG